MTCIHPASQIEASKHPKAILELTKLRVNRNIVGKLYISSKNGIVDSRRTATEHIVRETIDTVDQATGSPSTSRGRSETRRPEAKDFADFAANVIGRAEVPMAVLLVALVYIHRSRPHLSVEAEDWAPHRVFLGALMLASKVRVSDRRHPLIELNPDTDPVHERFHASKRSLGDRHWHLWKA